MTYILVKCPKCKIKAFVLDYSNNGCLEGIGDKIIDMAMDGSGIRDTARVLKISTYKVMNELKKENKSSQVNISLIMLLKFYMFKK